MGFIIVFAICLVISYRMIPYDDYDGYADPVIDILMRTIFVGIVSGTLNFIVKGIILTSFIVNTTQGFKETTNLYSLNSPSISSISGTFVLGTGSAHAQLSYFAYRKDDKTNALFLKTIPAEWTAIYEDVDKETVPRVIVRWSENVCVGKKDMPSWLFVLYPMPCWDEGIRPNTMTRELHVPKNTVKQRFSL